MAKANNFTPVIFVVAVLKWFKCGSFTQLKYKFVIMTTQAKSEFVNKIGVNEQETSLF